MTDRGAFYKDPAAVLDYGHDWARWLPAGDVIAASTWAVTPSGPVLTDPAFDDTATRVMVSGGTVGVDYALTNHVTTGAGREDERTIRLLCRQR